MVWIEEVSSWLGEGTKDLRTLLFALGDEIVNINKVHTLSRVPQQVQCPPSQFQCLGGNCVAPSSLCDGVKDCDGGEDEEKCGQ